MMGTRVTVLLRLHSVFEPLLPRPGSKVILAPMRPRSKGSSRAERDPPAVRRAARIFLLPMLLAIGLSACGGRPAPRTGAGGVPDYRAPGPPSDPWGPYINEASRRFDVPANWVRAVMRQESGGHQYLHGQPVTSDAGAMGLMQLMPPTYAELADRYGLGPDPYEPHDNIAAGTGYIHELYKQYGSPAFLAAYDAGPHRLESYLAGHGQLPNETVDYLASVAPTIARDRPLSGPLAAYADGGEVVPAPLPRAYADASAARCWQDPDAAYDPDAPCRAAPVRVATHPPPAPRAYAGSPPARCWQDPNAAYDPDAPCHVAPVRVAASPPPDWRREPAQPRRAAPSSSFPPAFLLASTAPPPGPPAVRPTGRWAIQVGAFHDAELARRTAESVRSLAPRELGGAQAVLGTTSPFGGHVLYRARLFGLSAQVAARACGKLSAQAQACVTVPPGS